MSQLNHASLNQFQALVLKPLALPLMLFALVASLVVPAAYGNEPTTLITAAYMVDVDGGDLIADPAILIRESRIVSVSDQAALNVNPEWQHIDLGSATILPGLIDLHTHLTSSPTNHGYRGLGVSIPRATITGVMNARTTLLAGFTTVRNVGAAGFSDVALRDVINAGDVPGPRMYVSGPGITITGGHCGDNNLLPPQYNAVGEGVADSPWAARAKVRRNIKYGADLIKTCSTGGVLSKGTEVGAPMSTVEELSAIVAEAHSRGLKVASHAHGATGIKNALVAGVDTIEHASFIDRQGLKMAKKQRATLVMDVYVTEFILGEGEAAGILPESLEKERLTGQTQRDNFRQAVAAGVQLGFGTDAGVYPHGDNARQFAVMVEYGMTPMQAIQAATSSAAEVIGIETEAGSLAVGKLADIIAVKENPLTDIRTLEDVTFVMKAGDVIHD